jgi:hypothetical protein
MKLGSILFQYSHLASRPIREDMFHDGLHAATC